MAQPIKPGSGSYPVKKPRVTQMPPPKPPITPEEFKSLIQGNMTADKFRYLSNIARNKQKADLKYIAATVKNNKKGK